ncbi:MAG: hypothetical protein EBR82_23545 [Caulobacteraceae bacterium]|nr:hypothetical protein [Caulobacteraceae bacterium]
MARFTGTLQVDAGAIGNQEISSSAAIDTSKMQHLYRRATGFGLAIGATPTTREEVVFVAETAGSVQQFAAMCNDSGTSASVTFDLKKNGVSILSSVVTITHSTGDRVVVDGTLASTALAAGDVLSIALTVSSSTGMQGPFAWVTVKETAGV